MVNGARGAKGAGYIPVSGANGSLGDINMTLIRAILLTSGFVFTFGAAAVAQSGSPTTSASAPENKPLLTLQMPVLPDPVRIVLNPATTALLVSDMIDPTCKSQPKCTGEMEPAITSLLAQARKAGVMVVYATRAQTMSKWLPDVAPAPGDTKIESFGQDRFYNTDLDKVLKGKGITTLILTGWKINGSITYTSVGATLRDYTVVVPIDATAAATDYETAIGIFQILNQSSANATNQPLKPKASTLSRTDLIRFQ
jgi:nicotinamidase-related amidase